nr:MAG TPA: hypothetical protein [Caudoviricetes sp.]
MYLGGSKIIDAFFFFTNRTYFCLFHFSNREEIGICPISFFRVGEVSLLVSFLS